MQYLKADTAATVLVGPFLDKDDGVTPVTDIALGTADSAEIMKHDGTTFQDASALTFTHKAHGMYTLVITDGFPSEEGRLTFFVSDASACLPVWAEFMVVNANVYDSLFAVAATDYLDVQVKAIDANAITATAINADAITSAKIADNALANEHFAAGALTATEITGAAGCAVSSIGNDVITPASVDEDADFVIQALSITNALDAGSVLVDANATISGDLLVTGTTTHTGVTTLTGAVSYGAGFDIVGALSANSLLIDTDATVTQNLLVTGTTTHTGAVTLTAGINAGAVSGTLPADFITETSIEDAAINNATFAADVGTTAHGTNHIALACKKILEEFNLDHLLKVTTGVDADGDLESFVVAKTVMGHLMSTSADATLYKATTDSMEAQGVAIAAVPTAAEIWDATEALTGQTHSFETMMAQIYRFLMNKMNITDADGVVALRNEADGADIMSGAVTDNDTTTVRIAATWA